MRRNLEDDIVRSPLWLGTGFHYAMEDFHGYNKYKSPTKAFLAYIEAVKKTTLQRLPANWQEDRDMCLAMLEYYEEWLQTRPALQTYWHNGVPQVEVRVEIPLPIPKEKLGNYDQAVYQATLDRVVIDDMERLWILDYKTAAKINAEHLDTDGQISAYCWLGNVLYGKPITGFVYQQHKKAVPQEPEFLKSSKRFSCAKTQDTTHRLYKKALVNLYGDVMKAPQENITFLNYLASNEDETGDSLIKRDYAYRNQHQIAAEGAKIMLEVPEMLDPNLPIYPNPTRDCSWDCAFRDVCISMDDGSDWEYELENSTLQRDSEGQNWRQYV